MELIRNIKMMLLYRVTKECVEEGVYFHYLVRYYNVMALLHSENDLFDQELALHCARKLVQLLKIEGTYSLPWMTTTVVDRDTFY